MRLNLNNKKIKIKTKNLKKQKKAKISKRKLQLIENFNEKLGIKLFEIRKIGYIYKLVFANKYVLNSTLKPIQEQILIYNDKEKKDEKLFLQLNLNEVTKESADLIVENIEKQLDYKKVLYKIRLLETENKEKNKFVAIYKEKNQKNPFKVKTEDFIENKYNLPITQNKIFITDLKPKADRMVEILNSIAENNNLNQIFYVTE